MPHRKIELTRHSGRACKPTSKIGIAVNGTCANVNDRAIITQTVENGIIDCRGACSRAIDARMGEVAHSAADRSGLWMTLPNDICPTVSQGYLVRMFEIRLGSQNAPRESRNLNGDMFDSTGTQATFQITQGRGTAEKVVVTLGA